MSHTVAFSKCSSHVKIYNPMQHGNFNHIYSYKKLMYIHVQLSSFTLQSIKYHYVKVH